MPNEIATANDHYQTLLAEHYTWMCGPFDAKVAQQRNLFLRLGIGDGPSETAARAAIDLGCGPGYQSLALAQLGFNVLAVDASAPLLAELEAHRNRLPIRTALHDLCDLRSLGDADSSSLAKTFDLAVCMGDTLTHLPSLADARDLFAEVARLLAPGGRFILGFRDLSRELQGLDRFIPVRSDSDRIMTCFLEYEPDSVVVHDLIHVRTNDAWTLRKSSYRKLRLSIAGVGEDLRSAGFNVLSQEELFGMWTILAQRPA